MRVDVQMSGPGQRVSFPKAAAIAVPNSPGPLIRASLRLHVLSEQPLWNTTGGAEVRTTSLRVPLSFLRRQGSSDAAKLMQTLIAFTETATATIPPNPYVQGAQLVGQLANSLVNVLKPNPDEVVDPNFSLAFGLSRRDTDCQATDLQQGIGAQIADWNAGMGTEGVIRTAELSRDSQLGQRKRGTLLV